MTTILPGNLNLHSKVFSSSPSLSLRSTNDLPSHLLDFFSGESGVSRQGGSRIEMTVCRNVRF